MSESSRIARLFQSLQAAGRTALVPYVVAGDPSPELTVSLMQALVSGGADLIELGVPFSDPEADGPDLQQACERALAYQVDLASVLSLAAEFRRSDSRTPVVLMSYLNPIECMGYDRFVSSAVDAGVDAVLVVNMPPEEADPLQSRLRAEGLDSIYMIAPTTSEERVDEIAKQGSGFLYYVALKGITGAGHLNADEVCARLAGLRTKIDLPLAVGFGIADGKAAKALSRHADAVVIGTEIARHIVRHIEVPDKIAEDLKAFMGQIRQALD